MKCPHCENSLTDGVIFAYCPLCGGLLGTVQNRPSEASLQERVLRICNQYANRDMYVAPEIPVKKLQNLCENVHPAEGVQIYALINATVFGSAKCGMLLASDGVYMNNGIASSTPGRFFLSWEEVSANAALGYPSWVKIGEVALSPAVKFEFSGCQMNKGQVIGLLTELRTCFGEAKKVSPAAAAQKSIPSKKCQYCDTVVADARANCPACGAPV